MVGRVGAVVLAGAAVAAAMAPQTTLDEGTFRLLVGGREVGTETFLIQQTGSGVDAVIVARGRASLNTLQGAEQVTASAQVAGGTLRPAAYDMELRGADGQRIAGRVVGGRFSARIVSADGENTREYLVSEGAVLADDGVAHHHYFIARRVTGSSARIPLLVPREGRQVWAEVSAVDEQAVTAAGATVTARLLVIRPEGAPERRVWVDGSDRVLRLEIPERSYVAERVALPR
jgi:hypothetical protein